MINYQPVSRPPAYQPPPLPAPPAMAGPGLGQLRDLGPVTSLVGAAIGVGTAWVGWTVGREKSGLLSVTGYVVAVVGALAAIGGGLGFIGSLGR